MVRRFFEEHRGRIERIIIDSFPIFERFHWTLHDVDELDWDDFCTVADGVNELYTREIKLREEQVKKSKGRQ